MSVPQQAVTLKSVSKYNALHRPFFYFFNPVVNRANRRTMPVKVNKVLTIGYWPTCEGATQFSLTIV